MNWILLEAGELDERGVVDLSDRRADHVTRVLGATTGQTVRVALVNGPRGTATVESVTPVHVRLRCTMDAVTPALPTTDLLLAVPRPKVMRRLWAPLASLGLGHIILTNAEKVERCYFDTHWLLPATYRPRLLEGLEQSGETHLPDVLVRRRLKVFLEDELDALLPHTARWIAHPDGPLLVEQSVGADKQRSLVAVGPEGGWTPYELNMLKDHGFTQVSIGRRVLRTDTACIALVSALGALYESARNRIETSKRMAMHA